MVRDFILLKHFEMYSYILASVRFLCIIEIIFMVEFFNNPNEKFLIIEPNSILYIFSSFIIYVFFLSLINIKMST